MPNEKSNIACSLFSSACYLRMHETRGTVTMMTLCDVIRFCDSFELRPGLVSTREILDAYKTVSVGIL